jgi:hypothetical protein
MNKDIIPITEGFWNVRGSYKLRDIVDLGTQTSLVRRTNGKFVFLSSYTLTNAVRRQVNALTNDGRDVEAILNVHPFHTVHVRSMHLAFPSAKIYGTVRHCSKFPDLPWAPTRTEDPATHALFADDFEFSVPRGLDFVPADENVHSSSVLVLHRASRSLHVDDTFMYLPLPWPLRLLDPVGFVRFHPMLAKALERRSGAVRDFRKWADEFMDRFQSVEHICAAHMGALTNAKALGTSAPELLRKALDKVEPTLRAHERKYG